MNDSTLNMLTVKFERIGQDTHCSLSKNNFSSSSLALKIVTSENDITHLSVTNNL